MRHIPNHRQYARAGLPISCRPAILAALLLALWAPLPASAAVPALVGYQGYLSNAAGTPIDTATSVTFRLYDAASGGNLIWNETQSVTPDNGAYSVNLGATTPLDAETVAGGSLYLAIQVGADPEMTPRQRLTSVAYSLRASVAESATSAETLVANGSNCAAGQYAQGVDASGNAEGCTTAGTGTVTAVSASGPLASTGGATPNLSLNGCATSQILKFNGTAWACAADADSNSGGTVTSVASGAGLTGGPITGSGSLAIATSYQLPQSCGNGQVAKSDGAGNWSCATDNDSTGWNLAGNAGTDPTSQYLGTSDDTAFEVRVNDSRVMRYEPNTVSPNLIGGSPANAVLADVRGATIAGGGVASGDSDPDFINEAPNLVIDAYGTVGGGFGNRAGAYSGSILDQPFATVAGGNNNIASGGYSAVAGGSNNTASGQNSAIPGGGSNTASGLSSTVAGGSSNRSSGHYGAVPGGYANRASGDYSFAAGRYAWAETDDTTPVPYHGAFLWADSNGFVFRSTANNELAARATGGVRFVTAIDGSGNPSKTLSISPLGNVTVQGSVTATSFSGNAGTATALAANGANCPAGQFPLGVDAQGNAEGCSAAGTGSVTSVASGTGLTGGPVTGSGTLSIASGYQLPQACGNGQVAKSNGAGGWICANDTDTNSGGTVTSITAGAGLSGGTISGSGTMAVDPTSATLTGNFFKQGGNAYGATAVIGTTDNQAVDIRVNGSRVMRYEPHATSPKLVGGHPSNSVAAGAYGASVVGGGDAGSTCYEPSTGFNTRSCANHGNGVFATVAGGVSNAATGFASTISGGNRNTATGDYSFAVGNSNIASGGYSAVTGGVSNVASGGYSAVAGGSSNAASGDYSAVAGGFANTSGGDHSVTPGGRSNRARGNYSAAMGYGATTSNDDAGTTPHHGAFAWADSNDNGSRQFFYTERNDEFAARARGGFRFVTGVDGSGNPNNTVRLSSSGLFMNGAADDGFGAHGNAQGGNVISFRHAEVSEDQIYYRDNAFIFADTPSGGDTDAPQIVVKDEAGNETFHLHSNGNLTIAGTLSQSSDVNRKADFTPVDTRAVLAKVAALPLATWRYKHEETGLMHLGPTAQDFKSAFGLGDGDKTIATVDADGVALAAIQGLYQEQQAMAVRLQEKDAEIAALKAKLAGVEETQREILAALQGGAGIAGPLALATRGRTE